MLLFTAVFVPKLNKEDVGNVLFHKVDELADASVRFNATNAVDGVGSDVCHTSQLLVWLLDFTIIMLGATPSPCPTVALAPVPV